METEDQALTSSREAVVASDGEKRTSQASRFSNVRAVSSKRAQCQVREAGHGGRGNLGGPGAMSTLRGPVLFTEGISTIRNCYSGSIYVDECPYHELWAP